LYAVVNLKPK